MQQEAVVQNLTGDRFFGDITMNAPAKIQLRSLFLGLQKQMVAELSTNRENIIHPGTKGDASELSWLKVLQHYLPKRYQIKKAFVLDSRGQLSEQIDIVIFDQQYSPFLFNQSGALYVPAESVYAVIEVKQDLAKDEIEYAGSKAASVRQLHRTSVPIPHAGGIYSPKEPFRILSGIVTLGSTWNPPFGKAFKSSIAGLSPTQQIDLGCALQFGSFEITYSDNEKLMIETSQQEDSLIFFFLHLLSRLQQLGTAPMIDIDEYAKSLRKQ